MPRSLKDSGRPAPWCRKISTYRKPASIEARGRSERYKELLLHGIAPHCPLLRFRIAFQNNGAEALPKIVSILSGAVEFFVGRDHGDSQPV
jgi:hypothetical protein